MVLVLGEEDGASFVFDDQQSQPPGRHPSRRHSSRQGDYDRHGESRHQKALSKALSNSLGALHPPPAGHVLKRDLDD